MPSADDLDDPLGFADTMGGDQLTAFDAEPVDTESKTGEQPEPNQT
jgi:hypothetical protein